jgi:ABC-type transport system involved in multi-copper enzyme maturation permease subunit
VASLTRIWTLAANTVREAVRNKLLYSLLFFAILLIASGALLSTLSYVEGERILQDVGMAAIRLFAVAIAIFVGVGLIHKEVDRRTIYTILSKPLSRAEFLLGKYVGLLLTIWMQIAIMVAAFTLISLLTGAPLGAGHAAAFLLTGAELALVVAVATLFSSFTTPMLSSFFSTALWVVGHLTRDLRDLGANADLEVVRRATALAHRVLPDLESFNLTIEAAHGLPVSASDVLLPLVYAAGYVGVLLIGAVAIFERRDFR